MMKEACNRSSVQADAQQAYYLAAPVPGSATSKFIATAQVIFPPGAVMTSGPLTTGKTISAGQLLPSVSKVSTEHSRQRAGPM